MYNILYFDKVIFEGFLKISVRLKIFVYYKIIDIYIKFDYYIL